MKIKGQKIVVCGAGGFIGGHLVKSLQASGAGEIRAVDIKPLDEWYQKTASVYTRIEREMLAMVGR
jgi:GDP-D-mannose 3', 5'-epimerase